VGAVSSHLATLVAYAAVGLLALAVELAALLAPHSMPRFGDVVTWALRRRSTQLGLLLLWWWLGWHWVTGR
jgi:hypothetical protein